MNTSVTERAESAEVQRQMEGGDSERIKRVSNAVQFLQNPRVKSTPLANKVAFLKSKGLSTDEVCEAFRGAGEPNSLDDVKRIADQHLVAPAVPAISNSSMPPKFMMDSASFPPQNPHAPHVWPLYAPQPQPVSKESRGVDWRDCVIAIGAVVVSGFAALKAFQIYSPYEIRRKEEWARLRGRSETGRHGGKSRRRVYSGSDADRVDLLRDASALPVPVTPSSGVTGKSNSQDEISRLQTELKEAQEALEAKERSRAELSVTLGKLRGQLYSEVRANERRESTIQSLQKEIERLQSEAQSHEGGVNKASIADTLDGTQAYGAGDATEAASPFSTPLASPPDNPGCAALQQNSLPEPGENEAFK